MARQISFFDGAASGTTPTIGNIVASDLITYANDAAYEAAESGSPAEGNIYFNTTTKCIRYYNGTAWVAVVDETKTQTLENKTIDGTSATGNNTITNDSDNITYDNATSGLTATDVKAAIDEVEGRVDTAETDIGNLETLSGVAGATDLGTFTEAIITDNVDIKVALQEIETALSAITDGLDFQGVWDANANTPTLVSSTGTKGHFYIVDTAGTTSLDGIADWGIGDWAVFDGTVWRKVDNTDQVSSVNTQTGAVVLDTDDISEGTNKYESAQASAGEITAATETALRSHSPADIKSYVDQHSTSGNISVSRQVYTSGTPTWNKPANLVAIEVEIVSGGGGGGGASNTVAGQISTGRGGGGGGYSKKLILAASLGSTESVTVGAGGAGGAAGGNAGSNGGTTSFGAHLSATGGTAGSFNSATTGLRSNNGGPGGVGSSGDINIDGQQGGGSSYHTSVLGAAWGGFGGSSHLGTGTTDVHGSSGVQVGYNGPDYGSGGSGSFNGTAGNTALAGGDGADGVVIVTEYIQI